MRRGGPSSRPSSNGGRKGAAPSLLSQQATAGDGLPLPPPLGKPVAAPQQERGGGGGRGGHRGKLGQQGLSSSSSSRARTKKVLFPEHATRAELQRGLKNGVLFRAQFRTNAADRTQGYCTVPGLPTDIFIKVRAAKGRPRWGECL
jgi:hypothetical protein